MTRAMTTNELKKQLISLGYTYDKEGFRGGFRVLNRNGIIAFTDISKFGLIDTNWGCDRDVK